MSLYNQSIAVVIPCYKIETHIRNVVEQIPDYVDSIILVNDCSPDNTAAILQKIATEKPNVVVLNHAKNQGVGGAMITGFIQALTQEIDLVVKIDGDGQMESAHIDLFVKALVEEPYDFAKGNRFHSLKALKNMPFIRRFGNLGLSFLIKAASGYWNIFDPSNGFFCIKTSFLKLLDFSRLSKRFFFESSLLIELYYTGATIKDIPLPAIYGNEISNLSVRKTFFSFPPKLLKAYLRRMVLRYFIFDFNINSLYLLLGVPLFLFGIIFGIVKWYSYSSLHIPSPTGTVMIATLSIILGFQMILSVLQHDMSSKNPFQQ
jgi:glycosyltransferase involved in cell wall biosynthesis